MRGGHSQRAFDRYALCVLAAIGPLLLPPPQVHAQAQADAPATEDAAWTSARELVARGEALFAVGNYDAALTEFVSAHQRLAGHPRQYVVLHNIALCHERMFRYDLALQFYDQYLREGGEAAEDRAEVAAVVESLRGLLATLHIDSDVPAQVWVDDRRMGEAPGEVFVPAGRHMVELRAPMREPARLEVQVGARQSARLRFELQPLSNYRGLPPTYFWIGVGLSAAALTTGAILGGNSLEQSSQGRELGRLHIDDQPAAERVNDFALAADICFGAALVFGVTTTVLLFQTDWGGDHREQPDRAQAREDHRLQLLPVAGRHTVGGALRGAF